MNLYIHPSYTKLILCIIINYALGFNALAAVKIKFNRIEATPGLSNSRVTSILQDTKGFLWVGTEDGLNRFDGYEFKVYRNLPNDVHSLLKNAILNIYEDTDGVLWISTASGGLHYYHRKLDNFIRVPAYSFDCEVSMTTQDAEGAIWIAGIKSRYAFAAKLNKATGNWQNYKIMPSATPIRLLIPSSKGQFWLGIWGKGFYKWNAETNTLKSYRHDVNNQQTIVSNYFKSAIKDAKGNIWITTSEGLSKLDVKTEMFTNYSKNSKQGLLTNNVWKICEDGDYIWIGNENEGLSRLDTRSNAFTHFSFNKNDPFSLVDNSIWALYKDRQGRIWVGTYSKGLCVIDKLQEKFSELDIPLENDVVNAIWQDSKQRFWVGTEKGLMMKDGNEIKLYKHTEAQASLSANPILSIFEDSKQQMWFGTWAGGLNRFDEKTKGFVRYMPSEKAKNSLSNSNVFCIKELSATKQLLVGSYHGLDILTNQTNGSFDNCVEKQFEFNNYLRTIFEDSKHNVWVGTIEELTLLDPIKKELTRFNASDSTGSEKVGGMFNCITEDSKGRIWCGTNKGLYCLINKKLVSHYTNIQGLPNSIVNGILEDNKGNLWLSTNEGVSKFNPENKTFRNYDAHDGLLSNEFKPGACFKNASGQFFFGGKGVNVFYPDSIKENPNIPPVEITDLKLFNQSLKIGENDSILKQQISETKEITLPAQYNFFTINYAALNFTSANRNQYAYQLQGFNEDWIQAGNQRQATFTNLDPGTYTFRVKASNNDGLWNEKGASIIIHILPPWWKTWWFRTLVLLLITAGIFIIFRIKLARERLKNELKHQSREIELKNQTLMTYTMRLAEKGLFINEIIESAHSIKNKIESEEIMSVIKKREFSDNDWEEFTKHFESANPTFFKKSLEIAPSLTPNELKLCAFLRLNLSSKEISSILRIQPDSVIKSRYRIRKKLNIESEDNLVAFLMNM